jgi:IS605 OrfB family transposase
VNSFVRTAKIKLSVPFDHRLLLQKTMTLVHQRSREYCEALLALRGLPVRVRSGRQEIVLESVHWQRYLKAFLTRCAYLDRLPQLYQAILDTSRVRGYMTPLSDICSRTGSFTRKNPRTGACNEAEPGKALCRFLLQEQVLPFRFQTSLPRHFDYSAWEMATSHIRSWAEVNAATQENYAQEVKKLEVLQPLPTWVALYESWKASTGLGDSSELSREIVINERFVFKFKKFGFDVFYAAEALRAARVINSDPNFWLKLFLWDVQRQRLERLRESACFCFPDIDASTRAMSLGHNYVPYELAYDGRSFQLVTHLLADSGTPVRVTLCGLDSAYFRDLEVTPSIHGTYFFHYKRGNNSDLPESVEAVLKEPRICKTDRDFYLLLPLTLTQSVQPAALTLASYHFKGQGDIKGLRTLSVDLGIHPILSMVVSENLGSGKHRDLLSFAEGQAADAAYSSKIRILQRYMKAVGNVIKYYHFVGKNLYDRARTCFLRTFRHLGLGAEAFEMSRTDIRVLILRHLRECRQQYRFLRRPDLHRQRQCHLSQEMFEWIDLTRTWTSVCQRWHYLGLPPLAPFERRDGFEKVFRYYAHLKRDCVKKIAQRVVYLARKHLASAVLLEDLEFFRMSVAHDRFKNALLHVWSAASIRQWMEHFAQQYGLRVFLIDPRHSSQLDPLTGEFGYRDEDDKSRLHVLRGDTLFTLDADQAAAANLARRFHSRYADVPVLRASRILHPEKMGLPFSSYLTQDGERVKRSLRNLYGSSSVVLLPHGQHCWRAQPCRGGRPEVEQENSNVDSEKGTKFCRHGDFWLDWEGHQARIQEIKALVPTGDQ